MLTKILLLFSLIHTTDSANNVGSDYIHQPATHEVVIHDSLFTSSEIRLDLRELKGWKFSPQDNPAFALPDFDDSQWYSLPNAPFETYQLPDSLWKGFGWFRLRIRVDSAFSKQLNIISPSIMGASEFYINSNLVLNHGVPSVTADRQQLLGSALNLGTHFEFLPGATYQIAVRYSLHHMATLRHLSQGSYRTPFLISVIVTNYDTLSLWFERTIITMFTFTFAATILLMVMLLHLFMYLSVSEKKANFAILILSACLFSFALLLGSQGISVRNFWLFIVLSSSGFSTLLLVSGSMVPWVTHQLLDVPVPSFWKGFIFAPLLLALFLTIFPEFPFETLIQLIFLLLVITMITGSVLAIIKARKMKKIGIGLVAGSLLVYPLMFIIMIILATIGAHYLWIFAVLFVMLTSMPVGMSIYQGKKFLKLHVQLDSLVKDRTAELSKSLSELKSTQSQLIQSEKMASLGELTAGIAHEIQNPLNFVNNFSEVSAELVDEMNIELEKGNTEDAKQIATDLKQNLEKINHHGKRAGNIVKGMLQHSRSSSGVKELTDLNVLCDEYLRLSYHGLRAKDKSFNAKFETHLDPTLSKVNVVPQDIGRVVLNLINNAFYAVSEKSSYAKASEDLYEPTVTVSTHYSLSNGEGKGEAIISVKDNGNGIPNSIKEKIFQPFFTTKPTGQGTGLGLSLSYDIVKAHGGELKVETKEGEGSTFFIQLPLK
jgi:signal transduction histidine kinase